MVVIKLATPNLGMVMKWEGTVVVECKPQLFDLPVFENDWARITAEEQAYNTSRHEHHISDENLELLRTHHSPTFHRSPDYPFYRIS